MATAYRQIRAAQGRFGGNVDLRTAAMAVAIEKIGVAYGRRGIFP